MRIGLTGTRHGLTDAQKETADRMVQVHGPDIIEWHQGGCTGADFEVSLLLRSRIHVKQEVWPGQVAVKWKVDWSDDTLAIIHEPMPPLVRNHLIVDHCDWLWAFPAEPTKQLRSGTWSTIRYADSRAVNYDVITPDGVRHCYGVSQST